MGAERARSLEASCQNLRASIFFIKHECFLILKFYSLLMEEINLSILSTPSCSINLINAEPMMAPWA